MAERGIQRSLTVTHSLANSNRPVVAKNLEPAYQEIGNGSLMELQ